MYKAPLEGPKGCRVWQLPDGGAKGEVRRSKSSQFIVRGTSILIWNLMAMLSSPLRRPVSAACWTPRPRWPSWRRLRGPKRQPWRGSSAGPPSGTAAPRGEVRSDPLLLLLLPLLRGSRGLTFLFEVFPTQFKNVLVWQFMLNMLYKLAFVVGSNVFISACFYLTFVCIVFFDKVAGAQPWGNRERDVITGLSCWLQHTQHTAD